MAAGVDVEEAPSDRRPRDLMREVIRGRSSEVIRAGRKPRRSAGRDLMREVIRGHQGPRDLLVG